MIGLMLPNQTLLEFKRLRMTKMITSITKNMNELERLHRDHYQSPSGSWHLLVTLATDLLMQLCIDITVEGVVILIVMHTLRTAIDCLILALTMTSPKESARGVKLF